MKRLLHSSKAIAAVAGILVTLVMLATGQIDGDTATAIISGLLATLMLTIAGEDAAKNIGAKRQDTP